MSRKRLTGFLFGAIVGLLIHVVYTLTNRSTGQLAHLFYALSNLAIVIPAMLASLLNWKLLPFLASGYWALAGWLYVVVRRQRMRFILVLAIIHLGGLAFIDIAWHFAPFPFFWSR